VNLKMGVDLWGEVEYTSESFIQVLSQEPLKMFGYARTNVFRVCPENYLLTI